MSDRSDGTCELRARIDIGSGGRSSSVPRWAAVGGGWCGNVFVQGPFSGERQRSAAALRGSQYIMWMLLESTEEGEKVERVRPATVGGQRWSLRGIRA